MMLAFWPFITIVLYRKKSVIEATLWAVLAGHMFLPVRTKVDLPFIPSLDKQSVAALSAFLVCRFIVGKRIRFLNHSKWLISLLFLFVVGPFFTAEFNSDTILIGGTFFPGMTHYDALSMAINQFIILLPFFMGKELFKTYDDQLLLFKVLVIAGLIYSLFIAYEVRMSPQLHKMIYGFFQHSFGQQKRSGGFRPMVFMTHGLWVAVFTATTAIAAITLWRLDIKAWRFSASKTAYYLMLVLVLCKSVASFFYGFAGFFLIRMTSFKILLFIARVIVIIALAYPILSLSDLFPHDAAVDAVRSYDAERAQSLEFRFKNEHILLERAKSRLVWGWGGWNREKIYDENSGENESTTDGLWIETLGKFGIIGFIAKFGIISLPIFLATSRRKQIIEEKEEILMASHTLLVAFLVIDQLPNATLESWMWLLVGVLQGRSETLRKKI